MEKPSYQQVFEAFKAKLGDEEISKTLAKKFITYNEANVDESKEWTVKVSAKKRVKMINWHLAINTFIRNISRYNRDIMIRIERNKLFANEN